MASLSMMRHRMKMSRKRRMATTAMVAKSVRVAATAGVAVTEDGSGSGEADVAFCLSVFGIERGCSAVGGAAAAAHQGRPARPGR